MASSPPKPRPARRETRPRLAAPEPLEQRVMLTAAPWDVRPLAAPVDRPMLPAPAAVVYGNPEVPSSAAAALLVRAATMARRASMIRVTFPNVDQLVSSNITITGQVQHARSRVARLEIAIDEGRFSRVKVDSKGKFQFNTNLPLSGATNGTHLILLRTIDKHGNRSKTLTVPFELDPLAPTLELTAPPLDTVVGGNITISGQATDTLAGVSQVEAAVDGAGFHALQLDSQGRFNLHTDFPLNGTADGAHTVRLQAIDRAGNVSQSSTVRVVLDTQPPAITSLGLDPATDTPPLGDGATSSLAVSLDGLTEPNLLVTLLPTGATTTSNAQGRFVFAGVNLAPGANTFTVRATDAAGNVGEVARTFTRIAPDNQPPTVVAGLANDTGPEGIPNTDGVTNDPTVSGSITDASKIASFRAGFDGTAEANFTDVLAQLEPDGQFSLGRSQLEAILGGALRDGPHTLSLVAEDVWGNRSPVVSVTFQLDTTSPITVVDLAPESDSAPIGDRQTTSEIVTLVGQSEPDSVINIDDLGAAIHVDPTGGFQLPGVTLHLGQNSFTVRTSDLAGNPSVTTVPFMLVPQPGDLVLTENGQFSVEQSQRITLGQATGSRTVSFELLADFGVSDPSALTQDTFLVYLVDPADRSKTLLDRGVAGTSLLAMTSTGVELAPGLVRYDGRVVTIDLTSLHDASAGDLVFQLLGSGTTASRVVIRNLADHVDPSGTESPILPLVHTLASTDGSLDLSALHPGANVDLSVGNVRFDPNTGNYQAELRARNLGDALGRQMAVVFPGLPDGVALLNPSGTDAMGNPYVNLTQAIGSGGLQSGVESASVPIEITDPALTRFSLVPQVLVGGTNRPPQLDPVGPLTVRPGDTLEVPLTATDPDGDPVSLSVISKDPLPTMSQTADGRLLIAPSPEQVGSYTFEIHASDGAAETVVPVSLSVVADSTTTTRISGRVLDTSGQPLADLPVELGDFQTRTDAGGNFLLELPPTAQLTSDMDIVVPQGDVYFDPYNTGIQTIPFTRAVSDPATGTSPQNPLENVNQVTSFIDASMIYGSDDNRARALRTLDGTGHLKTSPGDLLPFNDTTYFPTGPLPNDNQGINPASDLFVSGDVRTSENTQLAALITVFVREHNRLADQFHAEHPDWDDETIYQSARRVVGAIIQSITYNEFLPALLGRNALPAYTGYNPNVDPSESAMFSTVAFRVGHTLLTDDVARLGPDGQSLPGGPLSLRDAFFNVQPIVQDGIDPYLRGMVAQRAEQIDNQVIDEVRNFLFGPPGSGGLDLASLNIQRGRDEGLPDYNTARADFGLPRVTSFAQITSDPALQAKLEATYGSVDKIDPWVGGLCEDHLPGAALGPFFAAVIKDQFTRSRDGDRFWYENGQFSSDELDMIRSSTLSAVIARNTGITGLPGNVFTQGTVVPGPEPAGTTGSPTEWRTLDGSGNNLDDPNLGKAGSDLLRNFTSAYADGISEPSGADRPNARAISNAVAAQTESVPNTDGLTMMFALWGQLIDHDLGLTPGGTTNTIKFHGEELTGGAPHPFVAEKLPLLLGQPVISGVDNVVARPIYLPSLNPGTPINPNADTTVSQSLRAGEADAQVFVKAGTLETRSGERYSGDLGITEVPADRTPAALPTGILPSLVVTIQPAEMVFTQPAPLTLPNVNGLAPGILLDLWSINPTTGQFDVVGTGQVSADGRSVDTIEGGIRNSSWHFFSIQGGSYQFPTDQLNEDQKSICCPATQSGSSEVELHSGNLSESDTLASYQSDGTVRGVELDYDTGRLANDRTFFFRYPDLGATGQTIATGSPNVETRLEYSLVVRGDHGSLASRPVSEVIASAVQGPSDVVVPGVGTTIARSITLALAELPTGYYTAYLTSGVYMYVDGQRRTGSSQTETWGFVNINTRTSPVGAGWGIAGVEELVFNSDGSVVLVDGGGSQLYYKALGGGAFQSPAGDFSTLRKQANGTYQRTMTDGTVYEFDTGGLLTSMSDRNGNQTTYSYDANRQLTTITDAVGLQTQFFYNGGYLTRIVDPTGRVTALDHDQQGNLVKISDPDGTSRQFSYDADQRLTGETDKRGFVKSEEYDANGRVARSVLADGSVIRYQAAQSGSQLGDPTAFVADGNGNTTAYVLDQAGETRSVHDGAGIVTVIARNSDNQITSSTDGRGNSTTFEYDGRGNVVATKSHGFLASDSFSTGYVNGNLAGQNAGNGWSGAWQAGMGGTATNVSSTAGLTEPGVASAPGGVVADGTAGTTTTSRAIGLPSEGTLYVGFLANFETVSSGDSSTATGLWLGDRSESNPQKVLIGRTYTATPQYALTVRDDNQTAQTVATAFGAATTDGALDASFGNAGIVTTHFGNPPFDERISNVFAQPDGKIVAVGLASGTDGVSRVARYNADGTLDPSFSGDGLATFSISGFGSQAAALQADGKIVAVDNSFEVARMNSDGTLDTTFGGGRGWVRLGLNVFQSSYCVAIQPDGKILIGGEVNSGNPNPDFALARCNSDGTLDTTFGGGDGIVTTNAGGYPGERIRKILVQPDGTIVAVGQGGPNGFAVVRYQSDGTLDASFGIGGVVTTNVSGGSLQTDGALDGLIQPDGKVLVVGFAGGSGNKVALVRYNRDGSLDLSFGTGGKVTSDAMPGATSVALLPDGRILVGGSQGGKFALIRFLDNGALDRSFGVNGLLTTDIPGSSPDASTSLTLQLDGKAILAGYTGSRGDFALARYTFGGTPPIVPGSTHHLVVRIDFDAGGPNPVTGGRNDVIRLYVDPLPGSEPSVADAEIDTRDIGTLDELGFTAQQDRVIFDELRLGTSFDEVFDVAANGADRQFVARQVLSDTAGSNAVAIGDVTGDGIADLVHNNAGNDTVSIRPGDGHGTFGSPEDLAAPGRPVSVALADLNGDSRLDIVSANLDGNSVSIWMAALGGAFSTRVDYATAAGPVSVAVGDMNNDGHPDLAVLTRSGIISVLLNDGSGAFLPRIDRSLADVVRSPTTIGDQIVLGDLNHDGNLDAVIGTDLNGQVALLFGDGTGHLPTSSTIAVDGRPDGVALADLNGDGSPDLVVGRRAAGLVTVLLNDGNGNFPVRHDYDAGMDPARVLLADFNGDGKLDLVNTNAVDSTFSFRLGDGSGGFGMRTDFAAGFQPSSLAVADLDGEGDLDLVIGSNANRVVVLGNQSLAPDSSGSLSGPFRRTYTYDPKFNQVTSMTDELGHQTLYDIDPANGHTRSITQVVGKLDATSGKTDDLVTRFTYTSRGLVDSMTDPLGRVTHYTYDALGRLTSVTYAVGTADQASQSFTYDAAGNTKSITDENGHTTAYEYDAMNRVTRIIEPDPDGAGPLPSPVATFTYDAAGNVIRTTDPVGHVTDSTYDAKNRVLSVTDEQGNRTQYAYDGVGNQVRTIDPLGHLTQNRYDARNRLVATIDPDGGITAFTYDAANNMTSLTDPDGNVTQYTHDFRNRLVQETDPLGKSTFYAYDAANNLVEKTDRLGRVTDFGYDDVNRLTTELWRNTDGSLANRIDYAYDKASNLTSVVDAFSALAYTYDARNRILTVDNAGTPGAPHVVLNYAYDGTGNVVSVTDTINGQPGATTAYAYDALDRTTQITQVGTNVSAKRVDFAYNALGQYTSIARFADRAGLQPVVTTTYQYDELNRLIDLRHTNSTGDVAFYVYTYDASSRIASIHDIDGLTTYTYDNRDELTAADRAAGDVRGNESYQYDANGNRVASSGRGTGYVTGPGNRLLSDGTYNYAYDDEGNMILRTEIATGNTREFQWDQRNRLIAVVDKDSNGTETQRVEFTYDALGRRLSEEVVNAVDHALTQFVYDREDVILDFMAPDGPGSQPASLRQRYLHGPGIDQTLAQESGDGAVRWLLSDHLGTVRDIVDNSGILLNHIVYDSFGIALSMTNAEEISRYLYTGREYDSNTGLYYYRARYFDVTTGRFINEDPIGFSSGDPNHYRYVRNQSIILADPSGMDYQAERLASYAGTITERLRELGIDPKMVGDPMPVEHTLPGFQFYSSSPDALIDQLDQSRHFIRAGSLNPAGLILSLGDQCLKNHDVSWRQGGEDDSIHVLYLGGKLFEAHIDTRSPVVDDPFGVHYSLWEVIAHNIADVFYPPPQGGAPDVVDSAWQRAAIKRSLEWSNQQSYPWNLDWRLIPRP